MTQAIQSVFREIWNIVYPNNCVICNKYMENAFNPTNLINSLSIAIIDDVITTSTTLSACEVVLKKCGASKITCVSCCTPQFGY